MNQKKKRKNIQQLKHKLQLLCVFITTKGMIISMKILLMCAAGMSTSLLVTKMEECAKQRGIGDIVIDAEPVEDLDKYVAKYDVFLLGPQVRYKEEWVKKIIEGKGKKYANIPPRVYGMVDGEKTLDLALNLLK